tara:strand:+ start:2367 stop:2918 length:552 start_codon:yes stop_codon:yes gene_type:complete
VISSDTKKKLLELYEIHNLRLEGNILKVIELNDDDEDFKKYIADCIYHDKDKRLKRLEITKKIQKQNKELYLAKVENEKVNEELSKSLLDVGKAKEIVENDLMILQKKTQFELIGVIVKVALVIIISTAIITTIMYVVAIAFNRETQTIGSTWSNLFGILLTNSFSIIGTIMGVKYSGNNKEK